MSADVSNESPLGFSTRSVDRVCDILDILANSVDGVSLSDVSKAAKIPKSSAFRYLAALEARRYAEREPKTATYQLGLAFRPQSTHAVERLTELARPLLESLQDSLEETINLGVLDGPYVVHAAVAESHHMMRLAARAGERGFIHSTALGKAICAKLPEDRVRAMLASTGMPSFTEQTITLPDHYIEELKNVRKTGFGLDESENQPSGRCVGVLIEGIALPSGLSLSAPESRFPVERIPDVVNQLRNAADQLSAQMNP